MPAPPNFPDGKQVLLLVNASALKPRLLSSSVFSRNTAQMDISGARKTPLLHNSSGGPHRDLGKCRALFLRSLEQHQGLRREQRPTRGVLGRIREPNQIGIRLLVSDLC